MPVLYPQVNSSQYPQAIYLPWTVADNFCMADTDHWRARLAELIDATGGSQRAFADAIGVEASYVSRLLYPPTKKGFKRVGLKIIRAATREYDLSAGCFHLPLGCVLPTPTVSVAFAVRDTAAEYLPFQPAHWPFDLVHWGRLKKLQEALGPVEAREAFRQIDELLDALVFKFEHQSRRKPNTGAR